MSGRGEVEARLVVNSPDDGGSWVYGPKAIKS